MTRPTPRHLVALLAPAVLTLAACGGGADSESAASSTITVANCGTEREYPSPAERIYVYAGGMIAMTLALGAQDQIAGVAGIEDDGEVLGRAYGADVVEALPVATPDRPTMENVLTRQPDLAIAGWNYGWDEDQNLTPDGLAERDIAAYTLTESCRQEEDGAARGVVDPWEALRTDLRDLGEITGHTDRATELVEDLDERLARLAEAPAADDAPTVFLFDSGTTAPFSSGSFGGPQGIIEAAGARNATEDIDDTWVTVSWERVVAAQPDYIAFVDYPGQTFEQKVEVLRNNPGTRDLPAVQEGRFLNLPYAAWVSSPLNIDAAEQLRAALEDEALLPATDIEAPFDLRP